MCKYCNGEWNENIYIDEHGGGFGVVLNVSGGKLNVGVVYKNNYIVGDDGEMPIVKLNYCPMCGEKFE